MLVLGRLSAVPRARWKRSSAALNMASKNPTYPEDPRSNYDKKTAATFLDKGTVFKELLPSPPPRTKKSIEQIQAEVKDSCKNMSMPAPEKPASRKELAVLLGKAPLLGACS